MSQQDNKPSTASASGSLPMPKSKRGIRGFFKDVRIELKKVTWPTTTETNRLTGVVLSVCLLLMAILAGMGFAFDTIIHMLTKSRGAA